MAERTAGAHCALCASMYVKPTPPKARNLVLEAFVADWAERNGFAFSQRHAERRTTMILSGEGIASEPRTGRASARATKGSQTLPAAPSPDESSRAPSGKGRSDG